MLAFEPQLQPCVCTFTNLLVAAVRHSAAALDPHDAHADSILPRPPILINHIYHTHQSPKIGPAQTGPTGPLSLWPCYDHQKCHEYSCTNLPYLQEIPSPPTSGTGGTSEHVNCIRKLCLALAAHPSRPVCCSF